MEGSTLIKIIQDISERKVKNAEFRRQASDLANRFGTNNLLPPFAQQGTMFADIPMYSIEESSDDYKIHIAAGSVGGFSWHDASFTIEKASEEQYLAIAIKDTINLISLENEVYLNDSFILAFMFVPVNASGYQEGFLDGDDKLQIVYGLSAQTVFALVQYNLADGGLTPDDEFDFIYDGELLIEGSAAIVSANRGMIINPDGLSIFDIEYDYDNPGFIVPETSTRLASFGEDGLFFYDGENETPVSYFTKSEARVGGWKLLPDRLQSINIEEESISNWIEDQEYEVNTIVYSEDGYYKCILNHTSSSENKPPNEVYWETTTLDSQTISIYADGQISTNNFAEGGVFEAPAWNLGDSYSAGTIVRRFAYVICYQAHTATDNNKPFGTEQTPEENWKNYWRETNVTSADAWSDTGEYVAGDIVEYNNNFYVCIADHNASEVSGDEPSVGGNWQTYWASMNTSSEKGTGWKIESDGDAFFNDVTVFGTLFSSHGSIAGWEITDDYIANGNIVLASKGEIYTANYLPEVSGWKIRYDGLAEFNNAVIRSTLYSDSGFIGGWIITQSEISSRPTTSEIQTSNSSGEITLSNDAIELVYIRDLETGATYKQISVNFTPPRALSGLQPNTEYKIEYITSNDGIRLNPSGTISANYVMDESGWQISYDGHAEFNSATIRSTEGSIGGWTITPDGLQANGILIKNIGTIQTSDYVAGSSGWAIDQSGLAEFNNIVARGEIDAEIGSIGGWTIDDSKLYSGTNIELDSSAEQIRINNGAIKLGYNVDTNKNGLSLGTYNYFVEDTSDSTRKFRVGSSTKYLQFDGTNLLVEAGNTSIDSSGNLTATNVDLTGVINASSGTIGGWTIDSNSIDKDGLSLNSADNRLEVTVDSSYKMAFGYLGGIPDSSGGTYDSSIYGIWIGAPDALYIQAPNSGDDIVQHIQGDWIVKNDANILIKDGANNTVLNIGTSGGERGLFLYDTSDNLLAKYASSGILINLDSSNMKIGNEVVSGKDGIYLDDNNQWLTDGTFKVGSSTGDGIVWNGSTLTVTGSGEFSGTIHATDGEIDGTLVSSGIVADNITAGTLSVDRLDLDEIFASTLTLNNGGIIKSESVTDINTGIGLFLDSAGSFRAGDPSNNHIKWAGSSLEIVGSITAETGQIGNWSIDSSGNLASGTDIVLNPDDKRIYLNGTVVKIGKDVKNSGYYGIQLDTDYWETNGTFTHLSLAEGKFTYNGSWLEVEGDIKATGGYLGNDSSGWTIDSDSLYNSSGSSNAYSIKLDGNNSRIGIYSTTSDQPAVRLGMNVTGESGDHGLAFYNTDNTSLNNYWLWDGSTTKFRVGNSTNYLDFNVSTSSKLKIKTDTFDLESNSLYIKSGTNPYIGLGVDAYATNGGIWLGRDSADGYWKLSSISASGNSYLTFDTLNGLEIKATNLEVHTSLFHIQSSGTAQYIGLGTNEYEGNGIWLGRSTDSTFGDWRMSFSDKIKIGQGVLTGGGDGVYLDAASLEVNGKIETDYLQLNKSTVISLNNSRTIFDDEQVATGIDSDPLNVWVEKDSLNMLVLESHNIVDISGTSTTYYKNIPINTYLKLEGNYIGHDIKVEIYQIIGTTPVLLYTAWGTGTSPLERTLNFYEMANFVPESNASIKFTFYSRRTSDTSYPETMDFTFTIPQESFPVQIL